MNLGRLATGFALLQLPRMPELKGKSTSDFEPTIIDYTKIPYAYELSFIIYNIICNIKNVFIFYFKFEAIEYMIFHLFESFIDIAQNFK